MKVQSYLPFDCSTLANYVAWAQGIGTALTALGWQKSSDTGQVIWANVTTVPTIPSICNSFNNAGAWVGGTSYVGQAAGGIGLVTVVTNGGLTWDCILSTQSSGTFTALQNAAASLTLSSVGNASAGVTVYTVPSGVVSTMVNQLFVVSAGGGNLAGNNAGTFICTATSGTTSITLANPNGTSQSPTGSPTIVSSTSVISFSFTGNLVGSGINGALVGHSLTVAGWTGGSTANNATYTVLANAVIASTTGTFCATATGISATQAGVTLTENTVPASDSVHWIGYNFEIWKMTDALSSTMSIYMRLVYYKSGSNTPNLTFIASTGTTGTGYVSGNVLNGAGGAVATTEFTFAPAGAAQGSTLFESDFCVSASGSSLSMVLWRNAVSVSSAAPLHLIFDRARDTFGNELDTYVTCLTAGLSGGNGNSGGWNVLFKQGTGGVLLPSTFSVWPCAGAANASITSFNVNGLCAILPVFPLPGYLANPCLGAIMMKAADCNEGQLITAFMYGAQHTFLISKSGGAAIQGGATAIGIRFE